MTTVRASAGRISRTHSARLSRGNASTGGPLGTLPNTPTPLPDRCNARDTAVAATRTISAHGTRGQCRRPGIRIASENTLTATDHQCTAPSRVTRVASFSKNSALEATRIPSIRAIWLTRMSVASPAMKPTRIGLDRKLARKPNRKTLKSRNSRPPMMAIPAAIAA